MQLEFDFYLYAVSHLTCLNKKKKKRFSVVVGL